MSGGAGESAPHPATGRMTAGTLSSLQLMRGLAALAVAVYHTNLILAQSVYGAIDVFGTVSSRGWTGVNFFFVLSGFIIFYAHARDIGVPQRAGRYIWRRFARIYPFYWFALTAYILAAAIGIGHPEFTWDTISLVLSFLLVRAGDLPDLPLKVAWTLIYEMVFYAAFLVLILNRRIGIALCAAWLCAILYNGLLLGNSENVWTQVWNLYFAMGAGAYFLFQRIRDPRAGMAFLVIGLLILLALFVSGNVATGTGAGQRDEWVQVGLGIGFVGLMLGAIIIEREQPLKLPALFLLLGDASYAIYLVHSPVISVMAAINHKFLFGALPPEGVFLITATGSVVAGVAAHLILEKPLLRLMRRVGKRNDALPAGGASAASGVHG